MIDIFSFERLLFAIHRFFRKYIKERVILSKYVYVGLMFVLTGTAVWLCTKSRLVEAEIGYVFVWLFCFGFLTFNVSYIFIVSLYSAFLKPQIFKEIDIKNIPKSAIVYTVRNESIGLYERMEYSFANNDHRNVDLVLLSDSSPEYYPYEEEVIKKLKDRFGFERVKYLPRKVPREKKYGALIEWAFNYLDYHYLLVCDADSILGKGSLIKLLKKAEHPENQDIAIFQAHLKGAHTKTLFAKTLANSSDVMQRIYMKANQRIFGRCMSFGHGCLIRSRYFMETEVPKGALSHDIWETATLDMKGYRTVFCHDVIGFEEHPSNYLEAVKRDRRWMKGNFETFRLLFDKRLSFETKFYIAYGLYTYIIDAVFLFWILLNLFRAYRYAYFIPLQLDPTLTGLLIFVLSVIWGHKYVNVKSLGEVKSITLGTLITTLVCLNGVFHKGLSVLVLPFTKKGWNPMAKNPYQKLNLKELVIALWPVTIFGIILTYVGVKYAPLWALVTSPFLVNFTLSIPLVYFTSLTY